MPKYDIEILIVAIYCFVNIKQICFDFIEKKDAGMLFLTLQMIGKHDINKESFKMILRQTNDKNIKMI
jgi:hypothetical protein